MIPNQEIIRPCCQSQNPITFTPVIIDINKTKQKQKQKQTQNQKKKKLTNKQKQKQTKKHPILRSETN